MKTLLCLLMLLAHYANAADCIDLTGHYAHTGNSRVTLRIEQSDCDSADAAYNFGNGTELSRPMIFDGVMHLTFQGDDVYSYEGFTMQDDGIHVQGEDHWIDGKITKTVGRIYLDAAGNFTEDSTFLGDVGQALGHDQEVYARLPKRRKK